MVSGCNINDKDEVVGIKDQGGGLVKINTFDLWSPVCTMAVEIGIYVVCGFLYCLLQYGTDNYIISWETITGKAIHGKVKSAVFHILYKLI